MTGATLLIEHGALETRAALVRDGYVQRFWFGPALGSEHLDGQPFAGRCFAGRVRLVDLGMGAAFIDIGAERDAFLPIHKSGSGKLVQGASVRVRITAAARRGKGAVASLVSVSDGALTPGRIEATPAPIEALETIGRDATQIYADSAALLACLRQTGVAATMAQNKDGLFLSHGVDAALDGALSETAPLVGGGALHIFQAEALVAIDVDTGGESASSADRLREKVIKAAAAEAVLQIERRNLSGRIIIDFPSVRAREIRKRAVSAIEKALSRLSRVTATSISGANLVTLTRERLGASLWDETTEPAPTTPVSGRRFTLDWQARAAIRAAEQRQNRAPSVSLELRLGGALDAHMRTLDDPVDAYFRRWGAPIRFMRSDKLGDRDFDLVER